ncbi:MAG: prepilin-type N-terminal cleavage/methylation domain-containing protein, partial [Deltaproteobacteria bacterium]|nr:prepilin-type N-terminal cleavage/methylation domain-containing protein [Deltaproteobacteria bacterium]
MTRAREQGFTLIEIVVSLGLACLILVGALTFLNVQSRSHRDSMELQTMQMGLRVALDRVLRDARSASAGFSSGTVSIQDATVVSATGLVALDAVSLGPPLGAFASNSGPYALCQTTGCTVVTGSDVLNLVFADGRGVTNTTKDLNGVVNKQATPQTIDVLDTRGFVDSTGYPDNFVLVSDVSNPLTAGANAILARVTTITPGSPAPAGSLTLAGLTTQVANVFPGGLANFPGGAWSSPP